VSNIFILSPNIYLINIEENNGKLKSAEVVNCPEEPLIQQFSDGGKDDRNIERDG
jgi:hypothetical protein